jgi:hypothetical protein
VGGLRVRAWQLKTTGLAWIALSCVVASAGQARAQAAIPSEGGGDACEVHVWQSRSYIAATPSPLAAYGLIGAVLQSSHDARYPADTIQGQMERELGDKRLDALIAKVSWRQYLGEHPVNVVVETGTVSKDEIKRARTSLARGAASGASCYVELYIGDLSFEGGFIKSHLFANLTVRSFYGKVPTGGDAIVWTQVKGFPARDQSGISSAVTALRDGFAETLVKFVDKKLPRTGRVDRPTQHE